MTADWLPTELDQSHWPHARAMSDPRLRELVVRYVRAPHVAPINALVDALSDDHRWMPYVSPTYGGVHAKVLFLLQDPGPGTNRLSGSGFLCHQNDDPSAELFSRSMLKVGLSVAEVVTWNASPWYRNDQSAAPGATDLNAGVAPLRRLLELLPELQVVVLMGSKARDGWKRLTSRHSAVARSYAVLSTVHTSGRGITGGGKHTKSEGVAHFEKTLSEALKIVRS